MYLLILRTSLTAKRNRTKEAGAHWQTLAGIANYIVKNIIRFKKWFDHA